MIDLKAIRDRLNAADQSWNDCPVIAQLVGQDIAALIEAVERLEPFLDYCAGEGVLIGGVDSADLYIDMFPEKYSAALSAKDKGEENG